MCVRDNLKRCRIEKGMTQKEMANYLGISERGYKFIEYGERTGNFEIWDKLEDLFSVHQRILRQCSDQGDNQL